MQRLDDGAWVISPSDLTAYTRCPWELARTVDAKLGKPVVLEDITDPMMDLVATLGLEHEQRTLETLKQSLALVIEIPYSRAPRSAGANAWRAAIQTASDATTVALHSDADALFQAVFFQPQLPEAELPIGFQGFADFVVRQGPLWEVWDTKLARRAKDSALVQLAAYADQLHEAGIATSPEVRLILGNGQASVHTVDDLMPEYKHLRELVIHLIHERSAHTEPVEWGSILYPACGKPGCGACHQAVLDHDDLFQVYKLSTTQRSKLRLAGITTMEQLAESTPESLRSSVSGVGPATLERLRRQARMQWATLSNPGSRPQWEVLSRSVLAQVPAPNPGDLFFDFEGDPTYQEWDESGLPVTESGPDSPPRFGIEYLFGVWGNNINPGSANPDFLGIWAEDFAQEGLALERFCALVEQRLVEYPDLRVFHYASYERTKLKHLVARHDKHHATVTRLLDDLLCDLLPIVTKGLVVGLGSYGLKALEAVYFDKGVRTGIAGGGESVVAFAQYRGLTAAGRTDEAAALKQSILHYNEIDCFSTRALRDWLITAAES